MKEQKDKTLLADKIAGILNTAPTSFDLEDDGVDETNARVLNEDVEDGQKDEEICSKFRRANVDLLADLDEKYAGKKTSRRNLKDSESESEDGDIVDNENEVYNENLEEETSEDGDAKDSEDDKDEEDSEVEEDYDGDLLDAKIETESNFKHISDSNIYNQIQKGLCVRNQMTMWENLLEIRIQLQKCLLTANKMPKKEKFNEIKQATGQDFINKVIDTKQTLFSTIDKLLLLQKLVLRQFPETKKNEKSPKDDEEIPSDTEEESEKEESEEPQKKKRKLEEYDKEITHQYNLYKDYRNKVIQKWNDKTRILMKNSSTSHSILDQIEYNLSNKDKLIKRTQTKRSQYEILGEEKEEEVNKEIFDDDDFYHQLLRELIEVKSADVTDPVQLGRQWIQLQNLRSKMKRKVDTKATKGRKIRYAVHSRLVNFMAPIEENSWTDESKNELYNSLFGKNV